MALKNIAKMVHKANKDKTPAEEFLYMLNAAAVKLSQNDSEYKSGVYRPSSLGGCLRNQYYQVEGQPQDSNFEVSADLVGILQSGTDRHERIQNTVKEMQSVNMPVEWIDPKDWVDRKKPYGTKFYRYEGNEARFINTTLNLFFKCDGIIRFKNKVYILEIKTEASFKHRGRVSPVPKHIVQASAYGLALGIDNIMFLYENRDVLGKRPFAHAVTEKTKSDIIEEIETVETYRKLKKIPPMTTDEKNCTYCDFKNICKQTGETEEI